jgi:hypothetical protein
LTALKNRLKTGGSLLDEYGIIQGVEAREFLDGAGASAACSIIAKNRAVHSAASRSFSVFLVRFLLPV